MQILSQIGQTWHLTLYKGPLHFLIPPKFKVGTIIKFYINIKFFNVFPIWLKLCTIHHIKKKTGQNLETQKTKIWSNNLLPEGLEDTPFNPNRGKILFTPCPFWIRFYQLNFYQNFLNFSGGENQTNTATATFKYDLRSILKSTLYLFWYYFSFRIFTQKKLKWTS